MRAVRPPLVYGYTTLHGHSTVVVQEGRALRLADELDRVRGCATLGELRAAARAGMQEAGCPVDLDALADAPDDQPFDWRTSPGFLAGTWPPLPTLEIEQALGGDAIDQLHSGSDGEISKAESLRHGNGWVVSQHYNGLLAQVAADWDLGLRRDQALIDRLGWDEDWAWPEPRPDEEPDPA